MGKDDLVGQQEIFQPQGTPSAIRHQGLTVLTFPRPLRESQDPTSQDKNLKPEKPVWSPTQGNRDLHARSGLKLHSGRPSPQTARVAARPGGLGKSPQSVRGLQTPNRPPALTELGP